MAINLGSTEVADFKLGDTQVDKICLGDTVVWQKVQPKALRFSSTGAQTLGVVTANLGSINPNFEYSTNNGATWTTWNVSQTISFGNGVDLYLRGMNTFLAKASTNYTQFVFSTASPVKCSGNVMHLFDYTQDLDTIPDDAGLSSRGMKYMFRNCTALTTAPDLPATNIVRNCYYYMFYGCTNLTTAPATLPSLTALQECYQSMFEGCTSLTFAPTLPATTLTANCYERMFYGCTSLTTAPALPATTLAGGCYAFMFQDCTSLTTAPELPATTLAWYCYQAMFSGCTALTSVPELPATTLGWYCYDRMFQNCTSLTSIPALPATTLDNYCYQNMFDGCSLVKMSLTQEGEYQNSYTFGAVPSSTYATDMFANTGGTFTGTPTQQTLYTSNTIVS